MKFGMLLRALLALMLVNGSSGALAGGATNAAVMTRNLYIGADLASALDVEDPSEIPAAAGNVLSQILASDFPSRAKVLAQEIAQKQPHVVGLQEVWDVQATGLNGLASEIDLDFLQILMTELATRGQNYSVAAESQNILVAGLPAFIPGMGLYLGDIRDRDVILVRHNVAWSNPMMGTFPTLIPTPFGFDIVRGWTSVDIVFGGNAYRFVNTHLEPAASGGGCVQTLQALDLQSALGFLDATLGLLPQVIAGDFNSDPADPGCAALGGLSPYTIMVANSFTDVWSLRNNDRRASGETCCFSSLDVSENSTLTRRVDQIWIRRADANGVTVRLTGADAKRATPDGLFGSDHLGVIARMSLIPAY